MAEKREGPTVTPERDRAEALRRERLAEAMRANLQRRKAQQRGRDAAGAGCRAG